MAQLPLLESSDLTFFCQNTKSSFYFRLITTHAGSNMQRAHHQRQLTMPAELERPSGFMLKVTYKKSKTTFAEQAASRWNIPIVSATSANASETPAALEDTAHFAVIRDLRAADAAEVHVRVQVCPLPLANGTGYTYRFFRFTKGASSAVDLCTKFRGPATLDDFMTFAQAWGINTRV